MFYTPCTSRSLLPALPSCPLALRVRVFFAPSPSSSFSHADSGARRSLTHEITHEYAWRTRTPPRHELCSAAEGVPHQPPGHSTRDGTLLEAKCRWRRCIIGIVFISTRGDGSGQVIGVIVPRIRFLRMFCTCSIHYPHLQSLSTCFLLSGCFHARTLASGASTPTL